MTRHKWNSPNQLLFPALFTQNMYYAKEGGGGLQREAVTMDPHELKRLY